MSDSVHDLRQRMDATRQEAVNRQSQDMLGSGGGPPHTYEMEIRVAALEGSVARIDAKLDKLDDRLRGVESGIARLEGKVDVIAAKLPSWWQFPTAIASLIAVTGAVFGLLKAMHLV